MTRASTLRSVLLLAMVTCPAVAGVRGNEGGPVTGLVADINGAPIAGAVVSIFGNGLGGGGLIALSDTDGRFFLPSLPAGSYTLRTLGRGHEPAPARRITVLPNRASNLKVNLTPVTLDRDRQQDQRQEQAYKYSQYRGARSADARPQAAGESQAVRKLRWLLRHKRRSVLESQGHTAYPHKHRASLSAPVWPGLDAVTGSLEFSAGSAGLGSHREFEEADFPAGQGLLQLSGQLSPRVSWKLAGLVAEAVDARWRMAAEFLVEPGNGHTFRFGSTYGRGTLRQARSTREANDGHIGSLFVTDDWELSDEFTATLGGRYSYMDLGSDRNYVDPLVSLEWALSKEHTMRATFSAHTLAPGGELLTLASLSSLAVAPAVAMAFVDEGIRPERLRRYELTMARRTAGLTMEAGVFREDVRDQFLGSFAAPQSTIGVPRISNSSDKMASTGVNLSLARHIGRHVSGSLSYAVGISRREPTGSLAPEPGNAVPAPEGRFHDLVARVETVLESSDTRVVAYYRINRLAPQGDTLPVTSTRFDVQLNQGLPFIGRLTRSDWDLLLAVRNIFYEDGEGALLDELSVKAAPKRVVGGILVRF